MMDYFVGKPVHNYITFANLAGTATDPDLVVAKVRDRLGSVTTYTTADGGITHPVGSVGYYEFNHVPAQPGVYWVRWEATGALVDVVEYSFTINDSVFTP